MYCVDVNVLVNAVVTSAPHHDTAKEELETLRRAPEGLGLFSSVVSGFIRVATDRRVLTEPLTLAEAMGVVDVLTASPFVDVINPGPGHWSIFRDLVDRHHPRAHDLTDVWLAAAAMEINAIWVSFDRGFARFHDLRWRDPAG